MNYEEIYNYVKKAVVAKKFNKVADMAISVYVNDEDNQGEFYVEVKDGKVSVENFRYEDYSAHLNISSEALKNAIDGKADIAEYVDHGDASFVAPLFDIIAPKKAAAKKVAPKKAPAKKAEAPKKATK